MSSVPTRPAATREEHRGLLEAAEGCERAVARFAGGDVGHQRARVILSALAEHCRVAAGVFTTDPTLADEPYGTGRFRAVDLLAELARQTRSLLRIACTDGARGRRSRDDCWDEVEALFERAVHFAEVIPTVVPRRDHATEAGSRAISRDRLAAYSGHLSTAADSVRAAIGAALRLPHPDPQALALAELADQLARHAAELAAHHETRTDELGAACGLPGYQRRWTPGSRRPADPPVRTRPAWLIACGPQPYPSGPAPAGRRAATPHSLAPHRAASARHSGHLGPEEACTGDLRAGTPPI